MCEARPIEDKMYIRERAVCTKPVLTLALDSALDTGFISFLPPIVCDLYTFKSEMGSSGGGWACHGRISGCSFATSEGGQMLRANFTNKVPPPFIREVVMGYRACL